MNLGESGRDTLPVDLPGQRYLSACITYTLMQLEISRTWKLCEKYSAF